MQTRDKHILSGADIARLVGLALGILILVTNAITPTVFALTKGDDIKSMIDTTEFYDPNATAGSAPNCSSGNATLASNVTNIPSTGSAANTDYAGRPILNQGELTSVEKNASVYQQAAQQAGIPWQILAAIHYREHDFQTDNPDPTGPYQITSKSYAVGPTSPAQFLAETVDAANFIKQSEPGLSAQADAVTVKDAFVKYNGEPALYKQQATALGFDGATQGYEGSPYVMNFADARRDPTTAAPGTWLQSLGANKTAPASTQYGAFLVYASLAGITGVNASCASVACNNGPGDATTGLSQVRQRVVCIAQQELQKWTSGQFTPGKGYFIYSQNRPEDWCADFASWVYDQAGYPMKPDPNWNVALVAEAQKIGEANLNFKWHSIGSYTPRPGDLAIHGTSHINIVVGVSGTQVTLIGGNQGGGDVPNSYTVSKVTSYTVTSSGDITGYVSPD